MQSFHVAIVLFVWLVALAATSRIEYLRFSLPKFKLPRIPILTPSPALSPVGAVLVEKGWRTRPQVRDMSADDQRNTLIVELHRKTNLPVKRLQANTDAQLIDLAKKPDPNQDQDKHQHGMANLRKVLREFRWVPEQKSNTMPDDDVVRLVIDKIHKAGGFTRGYLESMSLPELFKTAYKTNPEYDPKQTYHRYDGSDDNYQNYCKMYSGKLRMCDHPVVKKNCKDECK
jgi:hypothetical protein